jgi:hypothetical protein
MIEFRRQSETIPAGNGGSTDKNTRDDGIIDCRRNKFQYTCAYSGEDY